MTTTAALPLSYIATTVSCVVACASTGIGRCSVIACEPCTSMAQLNVPISPIALLPGDAVPEPATTAKVGNTTWSTPDVFSVVKGKSSEPAPIPTAYNNASLEFHEMVRTSPVAPTASGFNGMMVSP